MGLEDIVRGVATIKIHCLKLEEAQLRESIGGTRIAKHAIFFKGRKPFHPEGWSRYCLTTWWSFCSSVESAFTWIPLNPEYCWGRILSFVSQWVEPFPIKEAACTLHSPSTESFPLITDPSTLCPCPEHCLSPTELIPKNFVKEVCFAREFRCSHPWSFVAITVTWRLFPKFCCVYCKRKINLKVRLWKFWTQHLLEWCWLSFTLQLVPNVSLLFLRLAESHKTTFSRTWF